MKNYIQSTGILMLAAISITSCAATTEVTQLSEGLFSTSATYALARGGADTAQNVVMSKATDFCNAQGKSLEFVNGRRMKIDGWNNLNSLKENHNFSSDTAYILSFRCVHKIAPNNKTQESTKSNSPQQAIDTRQPKIITTTEITADSEIVTIKGNIDGGGKIKKIRVDESEAPLSDDRYFSFNRTVPVGNSEINLSVTDEWGRSAHEQIKVSRKIISNKTSYKPLNPSSIKAKVRNQAIALIVGIDQYKTLPRAEFAENDANQFYDYATRSLGVPPDRIKLLTGSGAHRIDIERALKTWLAPMVVKGKSDVFVFFSGHGLSSDNGLDSFLIPYDGDRDLLAESTVSRKKLIDAIISTGANSAVFFLDTCYSGGTRGGDTLVSSSRPVLVVAKQEQVPPNVTIFSASANDQLSTSLPPAQHGLFSYYLMKGLEANERGDVHTITAEMLESYLVQHVPPEAAKLNRVQTPQLFGNTSAILSSW